MTTNTGAYQYGNPYDPNTQQRPSHNISPYYKVLGAVVVSLAAIALLDKLLHFWLPSLKDAPDRGRPRWRQWQQQPRQSGRAVAAATGAGGGGYGDGAVDGSAGLHVPEGGRVAGRGSLEELADGEALRVLRVCMHYFHAACVVEWLRACDTCPLCRTPLAPAAAADDAAAA